MKNDDQAGCLVVVLLSEPLSVWALIAPFRNGLRVYARSLSGSACADGLTWA